jgi:REP element-mobilizing transposase RayT
MPIRRDHPDVTSRFRLRGHDYASPGTYFVTLCTTNRACLFGTITDGTLHQSTAGLMVESWWYSIPLRNPSVDVADVVVMPNHLHGLVILGTDPSDERIPSLSKVVGGFKSITTNDYMRGVRLDGWPRFAGTLWQHGYFDHIVRTDAALKRIQRYIAANPSRWQQDDYHPERP